MARHADEIYGTGIGDSVSAEREASSEPSEPTHVETPSEASTDAAPAVETQQADAPVTGEEAELDAEDFEPGELRVEGLRKVVRKERESAKAARKAAKEAEKRAQDLAAQIQAMQSRPAQPVATPPAAQPTPEDIEAQYWADPAAFTRQHTEREVARVRAELTSYKLDASEDYAKRRYQDYGDKAKAFYAVAQGNRELIQRAMSAPDPGEFVYRAGEQLVMAQEIGSDPAAYRARIEAEARAKWEAEKGAAETVERAVSPPRSLAGVRGSGASASRARSGPRSAEDIYGK